MDYAKKNTLATLLTSPGDEALFYIRNGGFCGNCMMWWRAGGGGYTCNLKEAGKFTLKEAKQIMSNGRKEDKAYAVTKVNARAVLHFTDTSVKPVDVLKIEDMQEEFDF